MNYEQWLVQELAGLLDQPAAKISTQKPFADMGVDSMVAVQMSGLIADGLNIFVEPTVLYDYTNIERLAEFLKESAAGKPVPAGASR